MLFRSFLWKSCTNSLPTKENLLKKTIVSENVCHLCFEHPEAVLHALWGCLKVRQVWQSSFGWLVNHEVPASLIWFGLCSHLQTGFPCSLLQFGLSGITGINLDFGQPPFLLIGSLVLLSLTSNPLSQAINRCGLRYVALLVL